MKKAILLLNVGTPDNCDPSSVRRYLKAFLNDPRVVDIQPVARWFLVNAIILPLRYKKSAAAYQKIWRDDGSPLLINTEALTHKLALLLGEDYHVEFAMRYGSPNIETVLKRIQKVQPPSLQIVPLFPQYSSAATGSALQVCYEILATQWNMPALRVTNAFYDEPGFIRAYKQMIQQHMQHKSVDMLIFSYHGIPERHIKKSECYAYCNHVDACPAMTAANRFCYRAQCYATSKKLAASLELNENQYTVAFQSRIGRTPWIKPYTDLLLPKLAKKGVKSIAVVSPSFVTDCLETLEEVNIRLREQWQKLGGTDFTFIPCLNNSPAWVQALRDLVE